MATVITSEMVKISSNYLLQSARLSSFTDWPFTEDCNCTPLKLAEAGFYHCPTVNAPDLTRCFVCFKELEGWEPEDNPWEEHKNHNTSHGCEFLNLSKRESEQTLKEWMTFKLKQAIAAETLKFEMEKEKLLKTKETVFKSLNHSIKSSF